MTSNTTKYTLILICILEDDAVHTYSTVVEAEHAQDAVKEATLCCAEDWNMPFPDVHDSINEVIVLRGEPEFVESA